MLVLDTDHPSLIQRDSTGAQQLRARLTAAAAEQRVTTSIITQKEQMRGWLAYVGRAKSIDQQLVAYRKLRAHVEIYRLIPVLDFDEAAAREFAGLLRLRPRIGTMDLRIAAIALANDATLLTRNRVDLGEFRT